MREILYFQAGRCANFVGTHFWNAQESYFTYGEDAEEPLVDHDVSFREGLTQKGESTFSPRLLIFDRKPNFGAVGDIYGDADDTAEDVTSAWGGATVEYRSEPIPRSEYHAKLDEDEADNAVDKAKEDIQVSEAGVRYWSDYSRVFFHRRTIQRLPDVPEWEDVEGDWVNGAETFEKYDEDTEFMEESFRGFVEECDHLQGIQLMNDTATFGSFTHSFLTRFRYDFTKLPCLTFPILSDSLPGAVDADNPRGIKKVLNDALVLQGLSELSTLTVPLRLPSTWSPTPSFDGLDLNVESIFQTSAILATHIEDVTLPMRLKKNPTDLSSIVAALSWRNDAVFANLRGAFPLPSGFDIEAYAEKKLYDLSSVVESVSPGSSTVYTRMDVSRGFDHRELASYMQWAEKFHPTPLSIHAPAISHPNSFPRFFTSSPQPKTSKALSTLSSGPGLSAVFGAYASVVKDCLGRHADVVARMGLEADDVKELRDALWALEDAYRGDEDDLLDDADDAGEDEEY